MLFFKWGNAFDEDNSYTAPDNGTKAVVYAERKEIVDGIMKKYRIVQSSEEVSQGSNRESGRTTTGQSTDKQGSGTAMRPVQPSRRNAPLKKQEMQSPCISTLQTELIRMASAGMLFPPSLEN